MVVAASLLVLMGSIYATATLAPRLCARFHVIVNLMLAGLAGFFLTADLFDLYVWFELVLVSSFGLMVLGGDRTAVEGSFKYFIMSALGSVLLLVGIGLVYARTGTLNLAILTSALPEAGDAPLTTAISAFLLLGLGVKAAAFPLFFWLPAAYPAPPIAVIAVIGGMLTKVGVYGLLRLFTLVFVQEVAITHGVILTVGAFTMLTGVLGAVAQHDLRRLLAFHVISQVGYMLVGLGLYTASGVSAAIFFVLHILAVKTALFFIAGVVERATGTFDLDRAGGLQAARPAVAVLFLVPALALAGIPPLSGFSAKLSVVAATLAMGRPVVAAVALGVSLLTLYSMVKIWTLAFWAPAPPGATPPEDRLPPGLWGPPALLATLAVLMGLGAGPMLAFTDQAAADLLDGAAYVSAVLAGGGR